MLNTIFSNSLPNFLVTSNWWNINHVRLGTHRKLGKYYKIIEYKNRTEDTRLIEIYF